MKQAKQAQYTGIQNLMWFSWLIERKICFLPSFEIQNLGGRDSVWKFGGRDSVSKILSVENVLLEKNQTRGQLVCFFDRVPLTPFLWWDLWSGIVAHSPSRKSITAPGTVTQTWDCGATSVTEIPPSRKSITAPDTAASRRLPRRHPRMVHRMAGTALRFAWLVRSSILKRIISWVFRCCHQLRFCHAYIFPLTLSWFWNRSPVT